MFQKRTVNLLATNDILDMPDDRFPSFGATYREIRNHLELTSYELPVYNRLSSLDLALKNTPLDQLWNPVERCKFLLTALNRIRSF